MKAFVDLYWPWLALATIYLLAKIAAGFLWNKDKKRFALPIAHLDFLVLCAVIGSALCALRESITVLTVLATALAGYAYFNLQIARHNIEVTEKSAEKDRRKKVTKRREK